MHKNYIIIIFFLFYSNSYAKIPKWYLNNFSKNDLFFYSKNTGKNKQITINSAIHNLKIELIDLINQNNKIENFQYKVHYIDFPEINIIKNEKQKDFLYILISIHKTELFNLQLKKLNFLNIELEKQLKKLEDINDFIKKDNYKNIFSIINQMKEKLIIIKYLNNKFNIKNYTTKFNNIEQQYTKFLKNLDLQLIFKNNKIYNFQHKVINILNEKNIKINNNSQNILFVEFIENKNFINNIFFINLNIIFYLKDKLGNNILYNSKLFKCDSNISYNNCFEQFENIVLNYEDIFVIN